MCHAGDADATESNATSVMLHESAVNSVGFCGYFRQETPITDQNRLVIERNMYWDGSADQGSGETGRSDGRSLYSMSAVPQKQWSFHVHLEQVIDLLPRHLNAIQRLWLRLICCVSLCSQRWFRCWRTKNDWCETGKNR